MMNQASHRIAGLRSKVIDIALGMFLERGFDAVTMSDIAGAAGVSRRSLFRYFSGKDDIVFASVDCREGAFMRRRLAEQAAAPRPMDALQDAFVALTAQQDHEAQAVRIKTRLIFDTPSLAARMHQEVSRWQSDFAALLTGNDQPEPVRFARAVQVGAITAAYITAVRSWAPAPDGPLAPWVAAAFRALQTTPTSGIEQQA